MRRVTERDRQASRHVTSCLCDVIVQRPGINSRTRPLVIDCVLHRSGEGNPGCSAKGVSRSACAPQTAREARYIDPPGQARAADDFALPHRAYRIGREREDTA